MVLFSFCEGAGRVFISHPPLLSGSLEGVKSELRIEPFQLGTRRVAEVAPHLGLPVRGPSRRHAL